MPAALDLAKRIGSSRLTLWLAFLAVHLWLGFLNLYGPGYPLGDVSSVYKFWIEQYIVNNIVVGIDTQWVYPIVAYLPMLLAFSFGQALYSSTWLTMILLLDAAALLFLTGFRRDRGNTAAGWWWVAFLALLGPIAVGRIDSVTVPLALIGMLLLASRPRAAAVVLAMATWIKIWPAALLAAIVIATRVRLRVVIAAAVTSLAVIVVALLLGSGSNVFSFITQQAGRGLQIEAPISTPFLWLAAASSPGTVVYYDTQILTFQVTGPGTPGAAALMTPLLAVAALTIAALGVLAVRRGARATELLAPLSLALVAALIVFNKVGSPQFIGWLAVPVILGAVAAIRGGESFRVPAALALVIAALTQLIYPYLYGYLVSVHPLMLIAITSRNLLLIALLAWAVRRVVRLARPHFASDDDRELDATPNGPKAWPLV